MVPPSSDRVPRAPPYSRIASDRYPYGAVTLYGAPFQTLPVDPMRPQAWSAFARRYSRSRGCFPFLRLLRCFSSPGSPHRTRCGDVPTGTGCPIRRSRDHRSLAPPPGFSQRATSFIASRCRGIHQMPSRHSPRSSRPVHTGPPEGGDPLASKPLSTMSRNTSHGGPGPIRTADLTLIRRAL